MFEAGKISMRHDNLLVLQRDPYKRKWRNCAIRKMNIGKLIGFPECQYPACRGHKIQRLSPIPLLFRLLF